MCENMSHIDMTRIELNDSDQSVFVACYIQDGEFANLVRTTIERSYICEVLPVGLPGYPIPGPQCAFCIRVPGPKFSQSSEGNHAHASRVQ